MEEIYQITSALQHLSFGKQVAVLTDARFSGVSTGACIGHVGPEALAGGPIGKVRDGDLIQIVVDRVNLEGSLDLVGAEGVEFGPEEGARVLAARSPHPDALARPRPARRHAPLGRACRPSAAAPGAAASTITDAIIAALQAGSVQRGDRNRSELNSDSDPFEPVRPTALMSRSLPHSIRRRHEDSLDFGRRLYRLFLLSVLFGVLWAKGYLWSVFILAILLYLYDTSRHSGPDQRRPSNIPDAEPPSRRGRAPDGDGTPRSLAESTPAIAHHASSAGKNSAIRSS